MRETEAGIVQRIERLERESRRWRALALVLGLVVAAAGVMGQARTGRTVEAQRFVLKDSANRVRAELVAQERSVALRFKDEGGMPRLTVGTEDATAVLVLNDRTGAVAAHVAVLPHGAPGMTLYDPTGKSRVEVSVARDGTPSLRTTAPAWKAP
jgi:hypothetical protein